MAWLWADTIRERKRERKRERERERDRERQRQRQRERGGGGGAMQDCEARWVCFEFLFYFVHFSPDRVLQSVCNGYFSGSSQSELFFNISWRMAQPIQVHKGHICNLGSHACKILCRQTFTQLSDVPLAEVQVSIDGFCVSSIRKAQQLYWQYYAYEAAPSQFLCLVVQDD